MDTGGKSIFLFRTRHARLMAGRAGRQLIALHRRMALGNQRGKIGMTGFAGSLGLAGALAAFAVLAGFAASTLLNRLKRCIPEQTPRRLLRVTRFFSCFTLLQDKRATHDAHGSPACCLCFGFFLCRIGSGDAAERNRSPEWHCFPDDWSRAHHRSLHLPP